MSDSYFVRYRGRAVGPYTLLQSQQMARKGQLARTSEVSTDNSNWSQAGNYPEIFERPGGNSTPTINVISEPAPAGPPAPSMDSAWYYALNGEQKGPTSNENIIAMVRAGSLTATDRVWREGLDNWVQVSDVDEFAVALIGLKPTPVEGNGRINGGATVGEVFCRECGTALKRRAVMCPQCGVRTTDDGNASDDHGHLKQTYNPTGSATAGLVLGIVGLFLFFIPVVGISITVVGLVLSVKGMKSTNRGSATGGLVLNIVGLTLTILYWGFIVLVLLKFSL